MRQLSIKTWQAILIAGTLVSVSTTALAASNDKSAKALKRAQSSYTKYIEKAEKKNCNLETGKLRSCANEVKSLDKRYGKYSEEMKSDATISALNKRHQELKKVLTALERQSAVTKVAQAYQRSIKRIETKSCKKQENYIGTESAYCQKDLEKADLAKEKIPADMLNEPVIVDLIKRHDAMREMPDYIRNVANQKHQELKQIASTQIEFKKQANELAYWKELELGKSHVAGRLRYLAKLEDRKQGFLQFARDCKGKYAEYLVGKKDKLEKCELAENAELYIHRYAAATYKLFLESETERTREINNNLGRDGYIEKDDYKRLILNGKQYIKDIENRVSKSHETLNLPVPSFDKFEAAVAGTSDELKTAISMNSWENKPTVAVSAPIESYSAKIVAKKNQKLVKVGRLDRPWTVVKNELGIPLRKIANGWVMVKQPGESFCRMQYTTYTRTYDGTGYADISDIDIVPALVPTPCK